MKLRILFIVLTLVSASGVSAQYQIPLVTPGNSGGLSIDTENSLVSVFGQNVIGISEDNQNRVYFGILAPLAVTVTRSEILPELNTRLLQNYPNPFSTSTTIPFELSKKIKVKLNVANILGQSVEFLLDGEMPGGRHTITFNNRGLTPGLFLIQLEADGHVFVKTMAIIE